MTEVDFEKILRRLKLPVGELLSDGRTYRVRKGTFVRLDPESRQLLRNFDKFLVLSDGNGHVTGGVLFYGRFDLQAQMLPEHKGLGYMSAIHHNGILRAELHRKQEVSIMEFGIDSVDDFNMKCYLLSLIGLKARNEDVLRAEVIPLFEDGSIRMINIPGARGYIFE